MTGMQRKKDRKMGRQRKTERKNLIEPSRLQTVSILPFTSLESPNVGRGMDRDEQGQRCTNTYLQVDRHIFRVCTYRRLQELRKCSVDRYFMDS